MRRVSQSVFRRDPVFDVIKGLMMVWVVWGHLELYHIVAPSADAGSWMGNAKIALNMPIFFILSGCFAFSTFSFGSWGKIVSRVTCFMWPQVMFAVVCGGVALALKGDGLVAIQQVLKFWYLHTLALVYLVAIIIYRAFKTDRQRVLAYALFWSSLLLIPDVTGYAWWGQVVHMFPYFVFGLMFLRRHEIYKSTRIGLACGLVYFFATFCFGDAAATGMNFWHSSTYWKALLENSPNLLTLFARPFVGVSASVFFIWLVRRLLNASPGIGVLAALGTTSLGVYVIHEWILMRVGALGFSGLPFPSWTRWPVAIGYFLLCHVVVLLIQKVRIAKLLMFGDERMLARFIDHCLEKMST